LPEISCGGRHSVSFVTLTLSTLCTQYSRLLCRYACAVQKWRHNLTVCVEMNGEHFERSQ